MGPFSLRAIVESRIVDYPAGSTGYGAFAL
jgi:hypothetical protein